MRTVQKKTPPKTSYWRVILALVIFVAGFEFNHLVYQEDSVAAFAILPIAVGAWYFGIVGGLVVAVISILMFPAIHFLDGESITHQFSSLSIILGDLMFIIAALVFGRFGSIARERKDALDALELSHNLTYSLLDVTNHLSKTLSPDEIAQTLDKQLSKLGLAHVIALYDPRGFFKIEYSSLSPEAVEQIEKDLSLSLDTYTFILGSAQASALMDHLATPIVIRDPEQEIRSVFQFKKSEDARKALKLSGVAEDTIIFRLPLKLDDNLLGVLWLWGDQMTEPDLPVISIFSQQISLSLERARLFQKVQELALTDALTSLPNRRSLFEIGRLEFMRALRLNHPFSCLMLDLDHFKQVNDAYGHHTGDVVLQEFARRCKIAVRDIDMPVRYGGEEFVILLPDTPLEAARQVAERLREEIGKQPVKVNGFSVDITSSIGVSTKDSNTTDLETLIARADQAMFVAKHKGRNRVATSR